MSGINTSVQITDRLSPAFKTMTQSINICLATFAQMQAAVGAGVNTEAIREAQTAMQGLTEAAAGIDDELDKATQAQKNFNAAAGAGHSAADGLLGKVKSMVGAYTGLKTVQGIVGLSDTMSQTMARLKLMNDGLQTTEELNQMIYQSAQNSRASYLDTAEVVSRMGIMAGKAFNGNAELIKFTELMNKNFKIGSASAQEQSAAMYQLSQAMASGRLQGDEYRSIIENAPLLANAIEDYMVNVQHAKGSMKDWASQGLLTANVIKAAMFNSAEDIDKEFAKLPMTWGEVATSIKNQAIKAFQPVLQQITAIAANPNTQIVLNGIANGIENIAAVAGPALSMMVDGAGWVVENWSMVGPVVYGVAAAVAAYAIQQELSNLQASIATGHGAAYTAVLLAKSAAMAGVALVTGDATLMQTAYNTAVAAFPHAFIIAAIGLVVAALGKWINSVGGVRIAWAIATNEIQYRASLLAVGIIGAGNQISNACGWISLKFQQMKMSVANYVGNMRVAVLNEIRDMINGSISLMNKFIGVLNEIPGVSIDAISWSSTFGANAAAEEAKKRYARESAYAAAEKAFENEKTARAKKVEQMQTRADYLYAYRKRDIAQMKKKAAENKAEKNVEAAFDNSNAINAIAANTGKMADAMEISGEDLKYLRDIAERDIIDRTVFRDIKVELGGVINQVTQMEDLDGIAEYLGEKVKEEMLISAEGVH